MASNDAGLIIIEVSDPYNPVQVGNIETGGYALGLSTMDIGGRMYALVVGIFAFADI